MGVRWPTYEYQSVLLDCTLIVLTPCHSYFVPMEGLCYSISIGDQLQSLGHYVRANNIVPGIVEILKEESYITDCFEFALFYMMLVFRDEFFASCAPCDSP